MTGEESTALIPRTPHHVRVTAFNAVGYGPAAVTSPLALTPIDELPGPPTQTFARTATPTAVTVGFTPPPRDGGARLSTFRVDYDVSPSFESVNGSNGHGGWLDLPVVREVQAVALNASTLVADEQWVVATVAVTNEVQTVTTNVTGVNEVQLVTLMADEVQNQVVTVTTTAVDFNEVQTIALSAPDIDEVQVLRTSVHAVQEVQVLTVSATRVNEIQHLNITLMGDTSTPAKVDELLDTVRGEIELIVDLRTCQWSVHPPSSSLGIICIRLPSHFYPHPLPSPNLPIH